VGLFCGGDGRGLAVDSGSRVFHGFPGTGELA